MLFGLPGLVLLRRFVPWGQEPKEVTGESLEPMPPGPPWPMSTLWRSGVVAALALAATSLLLSSTMSAIKQWRTIAVADTVVVERNGARAQAKVASVEKDNQYRVVLAGDAEPVTVHRSQIKSLSKPFDLVGGFGRVVRPPRLADAVDLISALVFGLVGGLAVAAYLAARGQRGKPAIA
jgi:hypothetical protein